MNNLKIAKWRETTVSFLDEEKCESSMPDAFEFYKFTFKKANTSAGTAAEELSEGRKMQEGCSKISRKKSFSCLWQKQNRNCLKIENELELKFEDKQVQNYK